MNSATSDQNWISFFSRFERDNGGFVSDLSKKHPELTQAQI